MCAHRANYRMPWHSRAGDRYCSKGHKITPSRMGRLTCPICRSESGKVGYQKMLDRKKKEAEHAESRRANSQEYRESVDKLKVEWDKIEAQARAIKESKRKLQELWDKAELEDKLKKERGEIMEFEPVEKPVELTEEQLLKKKTDAELKEKLRLAREKLGMQSKKP